MQIAVIPTKVHTACFSWFSRVQGKFCTESLCPAPTPDVGVCLTAKPSRSLRSEDSSDPLACPRRGFISVLETSFRPIPSHHTF
eukprot:scaffold36256_cov30-Prasinocladus_malaysianus.AAC.2